MGQPIIGRLGGELGSKGKDYFKELFITSDKNSFGNHSKAAAGVFYRW